MGKRYIKGIETNISEIAWRRLYIIECKDLDFLGEKVDPKILQKEMIYYGFKGYGIR